MRAQEGLGEGRTGKGGKTGIRSGKRERWEKIKGRRGRVAEGKGLRGGDAIEQTLPLCAGRGGEASMRACARELTCFTPTLFRNHCLVEEAQDLATSRLPTSLPRHTTGKKGG